MKSKINKYKITKAELNNNQVYRISFRRRSIFVDGKIKFPIWSNIHIAFPTEQDAKQEIEMYIAHDNE